MMMLDEMLLAMVVAVLISFRGAKTKAMKIYRLIGASESGAEMGANRKHWRVAKAQGSIRGKNIWEQRKNYIVLPKAMP